MIVTTAASGDPAEAQELALRFGLEAQPRLGRTLAQLLEDARGRPVLVLAGRRADLYENGRAFRATVGMAFLRLLRSRKGEPDPLVKAARLQPGDTVLDATLGLGGDALLAAQATGTRVIGLERSALLCAFTQAALQRLPGHARAPAKLIDIHRADHREALAEAESGSVDVVLLDPMFRRAREAAPLFDELLRSHADHTPLAGETLQHARRVARKGVLVKDSGRGEELLRLGLTPLYTRRSAAIVFAWAPSPG